MHFLLRFPNRKLDPFRQRDLEDPVCLYSGRSRPLSEPEKTLPPSDASGRQLLVVGDKRKSRISKWVKSAGSALRRRETWFTLHAVGSPDSWDHGRPIGLVRASFIAI